MNCLHKYNLLTKAYPDHSDTVLHPKTTKTFPLPCSKFSSYNLQLSNINFLIMFIAWLLLKYKLHEDKDFKVWFICFPNA